VNAPTHDLRARPSSLRDYLGVLRRRVWLFVLVALLVPVVVVALSLSQEKSYRAEAEVLLTRENLAASLAGATDWPAALESSERFAQTQADVAQVPAVARRALKRAGLSDRSPRDFLAVSEVTPKPDSNLLTFSVTDPEPNAAIRLANEYARQYTIYRRTLDTAAVVAARRQIESRIDELEQAGERKRSAYDTLLERAQELRTVEALKTSTATLIHPADTTTQVQPRPVRNGVLGLILGLSLGVGLVFLREMLDTRVRSADEVSARLHLPLLARIPEPPRRFRDGKSLPMVVEPHGVSAEPFRMLRTNFELANLDVGARSILFTSGVEEEGKSTTIANLAASLARAGRHVVLVDLDLRRAALARFFGVKDRPGLTDVALGRLELGAAIRPVTLADPEEKGGVAASGNGASPKQGRLEILTSGRLPPEPGEFAESRALTDVLLDLWNRADYVLIDAPPLLRVHDAMALSAKVDALVVVTRLNVLRRPMLSELHRILANSPVKKLGFVLTGVGREEGYDYTAYDYAYSRRGEPAPEEERVL
jgi:succinoglycan biosynthesis transport protein ExoP